VHLRSSVNPTATVGGGEMGESGVLAALGNIYGCGGIDAVPQVHMRLAKKVYPQKREVMGYPAIPEAPFDLPHRRR
jgi:hypothetical protein